MSKMPIPHAKEADKYILNEKLSKKIKDLAAKFPDRNSAMLPAIHLIQDEFGWVPPEAVKQLAKLINTTSNKIYSVLTFYTMFRTEPVGHYHIQVCRNVSCSLMGAKKIIDHISHQLKVKPGETTPDGKFTFSLVECLGACGTAPVMMINDTYYENLTEKKIDQILKSL